MNNFTKEYISLCKCKEIQELRRKMQEWDFMFDERFNERSVVFAGLIKKETYWIWLPTGDQLDEEIIKICKEKKETPDYDKIEGYQFYYDKECDEYEAWVVDSSETDFYLEDDKNPLIAKISLLIKLLNERI